MDVVGVIVISLIIIAGITLLYHGNLIVGLTWLICGSGILSIALLDIWQRRNLVDLWIKYIRRKE